MMMFGWTHMQWSIALARTSVVVSDLSSYIDVKTDWACNYNYEPGEIKIAEIEVDVDNVATYKLHKLWIDNEKIVKA